MRALFLMVFLVLSGSLVGCTTGEANAGQAARNKAQCASFGFKEGTDSFANCMMQLSLQQQRQQPPDRDTLISRYRDLSMARRGDDRYPSCGAAMMDAELDISTGKWVGPNCQMTPD